jgi:glyoxalase family protein
MEINGIHHATMISSNAQRTVDFYTGILGMRLIKQTVNFDQPDTRHLYFSDAELTPGSLLTFFVWPGSRRGNEGIGGTHHIALSTDDEESQLRWKRWLTDNGVRVWGPYNRVYFTSIYFNDPDGLILEIATRGPGFTVDESADQLGSAVKAPPFEMMAGARDEEAIELTTWPDPIQGIDADMKLTPIHHISAIGTRDERTREFFNNVLGMRTVKRTVNFDNPKSPHIYLSTEDGEPGSIITYFAFEFGEMRPFRMGTGVTHHFALSVADENELAKWKTHLAEHEVDSSEIRDRKYFKSIYLHDPDGQIIELATRGPGFLIDEDESELGRRLQLPESMEARRDEIESSLGELTVP